MSKLRWRVWAGLAGLALLSWLFLSGRPPLTATERSYLPASAAGDPESIIISEPVKPGVSQPVRDLPVPDFDPGLNREINPRHNPLQFEPDMGQRDTWGVESGDSLIERSQNLAENSPATLLNFDGSTGCTNCSPPDVVGDVGPNHYVSMVNVHFSIFDKNGVKIAGPASINQLFAGSGGRCALQNEGDPIPLYDSMADRWILSQFANPNHLCVAVSQTPDPAGAYFTYEFNTGEFPDYFKLAAWPDGYYMSANESSYTAYVFDRASMLTGKPATFQKFLGGKNLYLPSDVDGDLLPAQDDPNIFYTFKDGSFHGGQDRLELWEFDVNWTSPLSSTFQMVQSLPLTSFQYTPCGFFQFNCIKQKNTSQRLDALGEWPMFRFPYRNFGTRESLVGAFTVGGGSGDVGAAVRWFELRRTAGGSWTLYQEGTQDPGDGHDRFNPSIAIDRLGGIALGYSVSSSAIYPQVRYATRGQGDPLGTLRQEQVMIASQGSQTGSNRWGDYSSMTVDPADNCTFWYTNQYYPTTSTIGWRTRIGSFQMPECLAQDFVMTVQPVVNKTCEGSPAEFTIQLASLNGFSGLVDLSTIQLPAGITGTFSQAVIDLSSGEGTSSLILDNLPLGELSFVVKSQARNVPSMQHSETVKVFSDTPLTNQPLGLQPNNWAVLDGDDQLLSWTAVDSARSYDLLLARNPDFTDIVQTLNGIEQIPVQITSVLDNNTIYYWRVTGRNGCGAGPTSQMATFITEPGPADCPLGTRPKTVFSDDFETDLGWTHSGTLDSWARTAGAAHSGSTAYRADASYSVSSQMLVSPKITLPAYNEKLLLNFWQTQNIENSLSVGVCWDGAVVEITRDGGQSWQSLNGSDWIPDYDALVNSGYGNPLGGMEAWCGIRPNWTESAVSLDDFAGEEVQFRFHLGTDNSYGSSSAWQVDDVLVQSCESEYAMVLEPIKLSLKKAPGEMATGEFVVRNTGYLTDTYFFEAQSPWPVSFTESTVENLSGGELRTVKFFVEIPESAAPGVAQSVSITARSAALPFISKTTVYSVTAAFDEHAIFMPLIVYSSMNGPDLVVKDVSALPGALEVTIENIGDLPVTKPFEVDLYFDPDRPPYAANETISTLGSHGVVWLIDTSYLPLEPGEMIVLNLFSDTLQPESSDYQLPFKADTPVFVQVDTSAGSAAFGAVLESHEKMGENYNNIYGPGFVSNRLPFDQQN